MDDDLAECQVTLVLGGYRWTRGGPEDDGPYRVLAALDGEGRSLAIA